VDLTQGDERDRLREEVRKWNPSVSFPTMVINNERCIVGFKDEEIRQALGK